MANIYKIEDIIKDIVIASGAATISKLAFTPFDRAAILMPIMKENVPRDQLPSSDSTFAYLWYFYKHRGIRFLWEGATANTVRFLPAPVLSIVFKNLFSSLIGLNQMRGWTHTLYDFLVSGVAGLSMLAVVYPMDRARIEMAQEEVRLRQGQQTQRQYNGMFGAIKQIYTSKGLGEIYRGFSSSGLGVFLYRTMYFGLFDLLKPVLWNTSLNRFVGTFVAAWTATLAAYFAGYSIDVSRRQQLFMLSMLPDAPYSLALAAEDVYARDGIRGFIPEIGPGMLRTLTGACTLALYHCVSAWSYGPFSALSHLKRGDVQKFVRHLFS